MLVSFDFPAYDHSLDLAVGFFARLHQSPLLGFVRRPLPPTRVFVVRSVLFLAG